MRLSNKLSIGAAIVGSVVLSLSGIAQAYDRDHDRDRWERDHRVEHRYDRYDHRRFVEERPVIIRERAPMVVERPVFMAPQPVYQQPGPSGLNLNFNIPLN